jgi:hypothetical protein
MLQSCSGINEGGLFEQRYILYYIRRLTCINCRSNILLDDFIERGAQIVRILEWYLLLQISTLSAH